MTTPENLGPAEEPRRAELVPVPPVYDAELVDPAEGSPARPGTEIERWRQVSLIPPNGAVARQAARDLPARALWAPWRTLSAVARGLVQAARMWRRWVRVHDYREAAEQAEKLADKFVEIRGSCSPRSRGSRSAQCRRADRTPTAGPRWVLGCRRARGGGLSSRRRCDGAREPGGGQGPAAAARSPSASLDRHRNPGQGPVAPTRGETHLISGPQVCPASS